MKSALTEFTKEFVAGGRGREADHAMPSLKAIRTRIASVKNTQKITTAMKLVAAARLRRAQDAIVAARPYAERARRGRSPRWRRAPAPTSHPLLDRRSPERIDAGRDHLRSRPGGGFNSNVIRVTERFLVERKQATPPAREIALAIIGRKGREYFRRRKQSITPRDARADRPRPPRSSRASSRRSSRTTFTSGIDASSSSTTSSRPRSSSRWCVEPLLPVSSELAGGEKAAAAGALDFVYEPSKAKLLDALVPLYVESQLYRALLESIASELGARMTAMDNATKNAQGDDRQPHAAVQPRAPGGDHQGADGDRRRRRGLKG